MRGNNFYYGCNNTLLAHERDPSYQTCSIGGFFLVVCMGNDLIIAYKYIATTFIINATAF